MAADLEGPDRQHTQDLGESWRPSRRSLLTGAVGVGAISALTGGMIIAPQTTRSALSAMSRFNDRAQARLFSPDRLAPTYSEAQITLPFRFNGFYPESAAPSIDASSWRLALGGRIGRKRAQTLHEIQVMPQESQITRLICIEGWSAIGKWGGVPLRAFLEAIEADLTAKFVGFRCADGYSTSVDMPSALHAQTILATTFLGHPLPEAFGFPLRLRIPTKLGFKNAKHIVELFVANDYPGGYWEDQGYNWYSGL